MGLHIAMICDGNRRWAVANGKNKLEGHKYGFENAKKILEWGKEIDCRAMTLFIMSTENFKRSKLEIRALFLLFRKYFKEFVEGELKEKNYKIRFLGSRHLFPKDIQDMCTEIEEETKNGDMEVNFCFGYGGRQEKSETNESVERIHS